MLPATFTAAQAERGGQLYASNCSGCHGVDLEGIDAPALSGPHFDGWRRGPASALFLFMRTPMPAFRPGALPPRTYADILAFILARNGYTAGETELPADMSALARMSLDPP